MIYDIVASGWTCFILAGISIGLLAASIIVGIRNKLYEPVAAEVCYILAISMLVLLVVCLVFNSHKLNTDFKHKCDQLHGSVVGQSCIYGKVLIK